MNWVHPLQTDPAHHPPVGLLMSPRLGQGVVWVDSSRSLRAAGRQQYTLQARLVRLSTAAVHKCGATTQPGHGLAQPSRPYQRGAAWLGGAVRRGGSRTSIWGGSCAWATSHPGTIPVRRYFQATKKKEGPVPRNKKRIITFYYLLLLFLLLDSTS